LSESPWSISVNSLTRASKDVKGGSRSLVSRPGGWIAQTSISAGRRF